jgi:putative ABC transport system permease protein
MCRRAPPDVRLIASVFVRHPKPGGFDSLSENPYGACPRRSAQEIFSQEHEFRAIANVMSLIFTLASRNLFHDRLRFVATVVGIVFSILLVTVQMGLYLGFGRMVTTMIDHASTDLWIIPNGTKCFEDPSLLDERKRFQALSINGVLDATPIVIGFAEWRLPSGGTTPVFIVGSETRTGGLQPWNLVAGSIGALSIPNAVAVDRSYFERLGIEGLGASAEIREQKVQVLAVTKGIRSFTTTPYVFTTLDRARAYTGVSAAKATYFLVRVTPDANVESVRRRLKANLTDVEVLTPAEFSDRSRAFWLFDTGAGAALFAGALLGVIVGTIIVAQTLYSSTKDHLNEFATLRAMGSSGRYIYKVIIWQALLSAAIGFCLAALVGLIIVDRTAESALPIVMTPGLTLGLFLLTVVMCVVSAIAAIVQVTRIDPAMVFTR